MNNSHGANIFDLSKKFNIAKEDIKDFSSNINPFGPPKFAMEYLKKNINLISTYPDPEYVDLKKEISKYANVNPSNILLGGGSTSLINFYIKAISPKRALILAPCYSEYENELTKINSNIFYYNLLESNNFEIDLENLIDTLNREEIDLFIMANPNNPTGTILLKKDFENILKTTSTNILVDETYIEFTEKNKYSSMELTKKYSKLAVVRGVSKFFASPGIRLGYMAVSDTNVLSSFENTLWNINIFADLLGQRMFMDSDYYNKIYLYISSQRKIMINELSKIENLKVFNSQGNFVLCKIKSGEKAELLRNYLLKSGMVIRDCSSFRNLNEHFFRFCILKEEDNINLINKIKKFFEI